MAKSAIVFVANGLMLPGLYGALETCIAACARESVVDPIFVFKSGFCQTDMVKLRSIATRKNPAQAVDFIEMDVRPFAALKPFHGDLSAYVRIAAAEILKEFDRIVYFDSDMLINSVRHLLELELDGMLFAAGGCGEVQYALEGAFYAKCGYSPNDICFNSGLLVIDADLWRSEKICDQLIRYGRENESDIPTSGDQVLLNALFMHRFRPLSAEYNYGVYSICSKVPEVGVIHYLGSPKPWDIGFGWLHSGYDSWARFAYAAGYRPSAFVFRYGISYFRRMWHIRRSAVRLLVRRFKFALKV